MVNKLKQATGHGVSLGELRDAVYGAALWGKQIERMDRMIEKHGAQYKTYFEVVPGVRFLSNEDNQRLDKLLTYLEMCPSKIKAEADSRR